MRYFNHRLDGETLEEYIERMNAYEDEQDERADALYEAREIERHYATI